MSRPYAYQVIAAADQANQMSAIADSPIPATESQARELVGLEPEQAVEVMGEAIERTNGKPTATAVRDARAEMVGDRQPIKVTESKTRRR